MSRAALTPAQIIEAARLGVLKARSKESLAYAQDSGRGAVGALLDLCLIDSDAYREAVFAIDSLAASRRQQIGGHA